MTRSLNHDKNGETLTKAKTVAVATGEVSNKKADAVMMNDETPPPVITPQVTPIGNCNPSFSTSSFI